MRFPSNPLLQLVPARLPQAIARVRKLVWTQAGVVSDISAGPASDSHVSFLQATRLPVKPVGRLPVHYGKLWDQRWFRLRMPKIGGAGKLYLRWNDQAEANLYVNGIPHYGFDPAHHCAPIPANTKEVWIESVVSQTGIRHPDATGLDPEGSLLQGAELLYRNDLAWDVLHDLLVLDDLMREELRTAFPGREGEFDGVGVKPAMGLVPPLLRRLLRHLDEAVDALDSGGLIAAQSRLQQAFLDIQDRGQIPAAVLTGHAHIDLVWLWPERVGEFKAVHTFATANRLMDHYPEFQFAYSQPASYEAVRRISPAMDRAVRRRMSEGRWEAHGATQVESDTLLACGEALARSFLIGQEGFKEIAGKPSPILWLPDVFGYSGCLPQLMAESGVQSFFTNKLRWNGITAFPHSSFIWAGADGSEVVAHLCHNNGYNQSASATELRLGAAAHRQCDVHPEFLAPTGFGDGGGGVTEEMCERVRRCASIAGIPPTGWGRLDGFFNRLHAIKDRLPVYRGELYLEYHRGTYTTHGDIKAAMRRAERALQIHEAARCASGQGAFDVNAWKRVVFAQFHDYIPGSSVHEVYAEARTELADLAKQSLAQAACALGSAKLVSPAIFNPLPHPRLHRAGKRNLMLPPLSGAPLDELLEAQFPPIQATRTSLSNGRVTARFDRCGRISSLRVDGVAIPFAQPANELILYPDYPHLFEAWEIDRQALSLGKADVQKAEITVGAEDIAFHRPLGKNSSATIRYSLDPGSPVLRITYDLDWQEENTLLKSVFPTEFLGRDARFGSPFGSVRRAQLGGDTAAEAMWEVPASRWAIVADDCESDGMFLVSESKYGFSCRDGSLGLSLVRSAKITMEERGHERGTHPEPIRRTLAPHIQSDIGQHHIEIAIGRFHPAAPREEHPAALADILYTPNLEYRGDVCGCGFLGIEGGESLQPAWAVPVSKDRWILRLHETLGRSGTATIQLLPEWSAKRVDLLGQPVGKIVRGRKIPFSPYKIVSLAISKTSNS